MDPNLQKLMGCEGMVKIPVRGVNNREAGFAVSIRIISVKKSYGRTRVLVTPKAGAGAAWFDLRAVTLEERP